MLFRISYIIVGNVTILIAEKHCGFIQVGNVNRVIAEKHCGFIQVRNVSILIVDVKRSERHLTVLFD